MHKRNDAAFLTRVCLKCEKLLMLPKLITWNANSRTNEGMKDIIVVVLTYL